MNSSTSLTLLSRLRQGENLAWRELVHWYMPMVFHWVLSAGLRREDAADISQDVFFNVSRNLQQFQRSETSGSFRGWLRVITRHAVIDWLRQQGEEVCGAGGTTAQQLMLQVEADESWTDLTVRQMALLDQIDDLRSEFGEQTWQAFWLTTMENRSGAEAAATLGMSRGSVYQAKSRVLMRLRELLGES